MAGTDQTREPARGGPAVVLVEPQLGENIGTAARAMLNFGLTDLRLVGPRDGWPNAKAVSAAAGATDVLDGIQIFDTTAAAIADLHHVFATTARQRSMLKQTTTPRQAANEMANQFAKKEKCGVLFGRERTGLNNDDVTYADKILMIPINPAYGSLNLAQAVAIISYEWFQASTDSCASPEPEAVTAPATQAELENFFRHLLAELDGCGFLYPAEKKPAMTRNIRNIFQRAGLYQHEVQTLHGIVSELSKPRKTTRNGPAAPRS